MRRRILVLEASTDLIGAANKTEAESSKKVHVVGVCSEEVRLRRAREVFEDCEHCLYICVAVV